MREVKIFMTAALLQLFFAFGFIILVCVFTYKMTLPLCLKVIDLCFDSAHFRIGICLFLAMAFCAVGMLQLRDFVKETGPDLSRYFPLYFFVSGFFLLIGLRKQNLK